MRDFFTIAKTIPYRNSTKTPLLKVKAKKELSDKRNLMDLRVIRYSEI